MQLHKSPGDVADKAVEHELEWANGRYRYRFIEHPQPEFAPVLFVSGAFQTMDSWSRFARVFAEHTTVLLVDPPGMGGSGVLEPEHGADFLADSLLRVLDDQRIERVNVAAASYGTPAAVRLAQLHPDRVSRVALAGTMKEVPARLRSRVAESVMAALAGDRESLAQMVVEGLLTTDSDVQIDRRELARRVLRSGVRRMTDLELAQYAANTRRLLAHGSMNLGGRILGPEALVFTGEHDSFTAPSHGLEVAAAFDRAWFTTIRQADHLVHVEQFDVVVALLLRFMRGRLRTGQPGCSPLTDLTLALAA